MSRAPEAPLRQRKRLPAAGVPALDAAVIARAGYRPTPATKETIFAAPGPGPAPGAHRSLQQAFGGKFLLRAARSLGSAFIDAHPRHGLNAPHRTTRGCTASRPAGTPLRGALPMPAVKARTLVDRGRILAWNTLTIAVFVALTAYVARIDAILR
ncbi:hypothetical protein Maq22A_c27985 [Methylobacterium aquaticum]|uniref:Uncharacterized protein n=2 Tax=Methylobacterium TaxID=407 RepID=A0A1Y0ZFK6_9HYPH|nr:hypothetical protein Maq22A_c27985 [Methylobacterium aquaticum]